MGGVLPGPPGPLFETVVRHRLTPSPGRIGGPGGIVPPGPILRILPPLERVHDHDRRREKAANVSGGLYVNQSIGFRLVDTAFVEEVVDAALGGVVTHMRHRPPDDHVSGDGLVIVLGDEFLHDVDEGLF